jgi:hypothetical protein
VAGEGWEEGVSIRGGRERLEKRGEDDASKHDVNLVNVISNPSCYPILIQIITCHSIDPILSTTSHHSSL